jgi:phenylacetic acid degradation protein
MAVYSLDGLTPVVDASSFIHPLAALIGDVIVAPRCYIGPGAVLRGDMGRIVISAGSNVQDNCVLHTFPAKEVLLEENSHIGHGAVLHGCVVRRGALVGINAIIMDDAVVGEQALVGAGSFVRAGFAVPPRMLIVGSPARIIRELTAEELEWKATGTREYQQLTERCLGTLRECEPLRAPEAGRTGFGPTAMAPLSALERSKP